MEMLRGEMLVLCIMSTLSLGFSGDTFKSFLASHYADIENYIMTGYGDGWKHCDNLILGPDFHRVNGKASTLVMNFETMQSVDISSTFSPAHCLLLVAHINDTKTLSQIIQFGWKTIQHKRIGMLLKMESNMSLDMTRNTTKLPFLVASELTNGTIQFLCPAIGRNEPFLQAHMCEKSHVSLVGKTITVGVYGHWPYVHMGYMIGADIMLLNLLKNKMMFDTRIELASSFNAAFKVAYGRNAELVMSRNGYYHSQLSRVDYLWPLDTWRIYLVSGRPRRMPNFLTLINPMDRTTWLLLTLSIPTMISSIFVVDKLYGRQRNTTRRNILHRSIFITIAFLLEEKLTKKYVNKKRCFKARHLLIMEWMLYGYVLSLGYKSVLLSTLVSVSYEKPVDTVKEAINADKPIVALGNSTTETRLKTDVRASVRKLANMIKWYDLDEKLSVPTWVLNGMLTSELIHLTSPTVEQYFGDKVYMGKEQILSWGYAFILPKSSPLKENFLMTIAWSKDTGVLAKMLNTMITSNRENKSLLKVRGNQPLSLNHLSPIFILFGFGVGISILCFIFEKMIRRPPTSTVEDFELR